MLERSFWLSELGGENPVKLSVGGKSEKLTRAWGPWEAGEGSGRRGDAERGGGSVRVTLSVAQAGIPIAVVTSATTSHGAAQAGRGAQAGRPRPLLTFSGRFCHRRGVFVLPQLQAGPKRDGLLPAGPRPHLQPAVPGQEVTTATGQRDGPRG